MIDKLFLMLIISCLENAPDKIRRSFSDKLKWILIYLGAEQGHYLPASFPNFLVTIILVTAMQPEDAG